jgi:hypothetical protein
MARLALSDAAAGWNRAMAGTTGGSGGVPDDIPADLYPPDRDDPDAWNYGPTSYGASQRLRQGASVTYGGRLCSTWAAVHRGMDLPAVVAVSSAIREDIAAANLRELPDVAARLESATSELAWVDVLGDVWGATGFGRMVDLVASVPMLGTIARLAFGLGGLISDLIRARREAPIVIEAAASRYSQATDRAAFARLRDVLRSTDASLLDVYSPVGWRATPEPFLPMHARIVGVVPLRGGGWRFEARARPSGVPGDPNNAPGAYGWGAMPGGRNVHAGIEVLPRGDQWIVTDPGVWVPTIGGQTPIVWESIRPLTRAPTVRVFDLDAAELERRWTFYSQALRESVSVSGNLPREARAAALRWGVQAGLWTTPPDELGGRIDGVGPPAVIVAARDLAAAQRATAQSLAVLDMGPNDGAAIYQRIDPDVRALARSTYQRILATPDVLCRVDLERLDPNERDWIATLQAERCGPGDTAITTLAAGPWASPPPLVPGGTPAGGYGAELGDALPGGDGGAMAAAILLGGAVVAAVGVGVYRRQRRSKR